MAEELERKRAEFAYDQVKAWQKGKGTRDRVNEVLPGLPVRLRTQGLLITLATLRAKDDGALVEALDAWLTRRAPRRLLAGNDTRDILERCMGASRDEYLAAQREAIAISQTLKLMAKALISPQSES